MNEPASVSREEQQRAWIARVHQEHEQRRLNNQPDEHGISGAMVDKMLAVWAEGMSTGADSLRSLMYCAYREARALEAK